MKLGPLGLSWGPLGGSSWGQDGAKLGQVGPKMGQVGTKLGLSWHLEPSWRQLGGNLAEDAIILLKMRRKRQK